MIIKTLFAELKRILHPGALIAVNVDGNKQKENVIASAFGFFILYIFTSVLLSLHLYGRVSMP